MAELCMVENNEMEKAILYNVGMRTGRFTLCQHGSRYGIGGVGAMVK